jgi:hypothetical protein
MLRTTDSQLGATRERGNVKILMGLMDDEEGRSNNEVRSVQAQADQRESRGIGVLNFSPLLLLQIIHKDHAVNALTYSSASVLDPILNQIDSTHSPQKHHGSHMYTFSQQIVIYTY